MSDVVYGVGLDASKVLKETKKVKASEKQLQDQLKKTNKGIDKQEKSLNKTAKAGKFYTKQLVQMGAALVGLRAGFAVISSAVRTNIEFEQSLANVRAVMQPTVQEFALMSKVIRDQAKVTVFSANEVSKGMEFLGMAGLNAVTSMKALPGVLELAAAGSLSMAEAANISTNIMSGMRLEAEDLAKVNDNLAYTAANSNTNIQQLGEAFRVTAGIASATNQDISEVSKVLGAMANRGLQGANAGEKYKQMLNRLIKPASAAQSALNRLGVTTKDSSGKMRPLSKIMTELTKSGMSGSDAIDIFGRFTASAALAVSGAIPDIEKLEKGLKGSAGAAKEMADVKIDTLAGDLKLLASAWQEVILTTNESNKTLRTFVQGITKALSYVDLGKSFQMVSGIMGAIANSVVFTVESIWGSMKLLATILVEPFKIMWSTAEDVFTNIAKASSLLASGEFGKAIDQMGELKNAGDQASKSWENIKQDYKELGDSVTKFQQINAQAWKDITMQTEKEDTALKDLNKEKKKGAPKNIELLDEEIKKLSKILELRKSLLKARKILKDEVPDLINIDNLDEGNIKLEQFATMGERVAMSLKESFTNIAEGGLKSFISAGLDGTNALEAGVNALKNSVIELASTLASKAIIFGLLSLIPGSGVGGGIAGLLKYMGFKDGIIGFDSGVIGMGGAGTGTSDSNLARLSKGESVMTAKATSMYAPLLASLERSASGSVNYGGNTGSSYANGSIGVQTGGSGNNINELVAEIRYLKKQVLLSGNATTKAVQGFQPLKFKGVSKAGIYEFYEEGKKEANPIGQTS